MGLWSEVAEKETPGEEKAKEEAKMETIRPASGQAYPEREATLSEGLTVEGKIEGSGRLCIACNFKGEIQLKGHLRVGSKAHVNGEVKAENITIEGVVEANVTSSGEVKLLNNAQLIGDLKAKSLVVASGARMRGKVEFGWEQHERPKLEIKKPKKAPVSPGPNGPEITDSANSGKRTLD